MKKIVLLLALVGALVPPLPAYAGHGACGRLRAFRPVRRAVRLAALPLRLVLHRGHGHARGACR